MSLQTNLVTTHPGRSARDRLQHERLDCALAEDDRIKEGLRQGSK